MEGGRCEQCGEVFEGPAVEFRKHIFCSDQCCDEYEDRMALNGEPNPHDLDDDFTDEDFEDLDFEEDADDEDDLDDEEFEGFEDDDF